jgi:hypothetical protein
MINSFGLSSPRRRVIRRIGTSPNRNVSRRIEAARDLALLALNNAIGQWIMDRAGALLAGQRRHLDRSAISREEFNDHVD